MLHRSAPTAFRADFDFGSRERSGLETGRLPPVAQTATMGLYSAWRKAIYEEPVMVWSLMLYASGERSRTPRA